MSHRHVVKRLMAGAAAALLLVVCVVLPVSSEAAEITFTMETNAGSQETIRIEALNGEDAADAMVRWLDHDASSDHIIAAKSFLDVARGLSENVPSPRSGDPEKDNIETKEEKTCEDDAKNRFHKRSDLNALAIALRDVLKSVSPEDDTAAFESAYQDAIFGKKLHVALGEAGISAEEDDDEWEITACDNYEDADLIVKKLLVSLSEEGFNSVRASLILKGLKCAIAKARWPHVLKSTTSIVRYSPSSGSWKQDEPRTLAVILGARAAVALGDTDKAKRIFASALNFDPDSPPLKEGFGRVKQYTRKLKKADKSLKKGFYRRAGGELDDARTELDRLQADSKLLLADLHVRYCKHRAATKKHEEAIEHCDIALQMRAEETASIAGLLIDPRDRIDVLRARADAHVKDRNYEEAVADLREAIELTEKTGQGESSELLGGLKAKLSEAQREEEKWSRLSERDHIAVLDLPTNIDEIELKGKCKWLKKKYREQSVRWHPDRSTSNSKRAGRKFEEVNTAYEILQAQWGCKGGRVANKEQRAEMQKELQEIFQKERGGRPGGRGGGFPGGFPGGFSFPGGGGGGGGRRGSQPRPPPRRRGRRGR